MVNDSKGNVVDMVVAIVWCFVCNGFVVTYL